MRILLNDFGGHAFPIELSRELVRRGNTVSHLYFADNLSTPKGKTEESEIDSERFSIEGLHIPYEFQKHSILTRRRADIAYGNAVAAKIISFQPDIVLSANTPLDSQRIIYREARRVNARFLFWMQDIYSSAVRFVIRKKSGSLSEVIGEYYEWLEKRLLRKSDGVICISPEFAHLATRWGVEAARVHMIENWAPLAEVVPASKDNAWSREHGVSNKFCFMYSGTLGMKHRADLLLALAQHLAAKGGAQLVVNAEGAGADWLRENSKSIPESALQILPLQPYERISEVLGSADVLIALLDTNAGAFAVPSKILSYLCAGRPILLASPAENHAAAVVTRAEAGMAVPADRKDHFVDAACQLMVSTKLRARFAANARAYAERTFDIGRIANRFLAVFSAPPQSRLFAEKDLIAAHEEVGEREK